MSFPNSITSQDYPAFNLNPYINSIRAKDGRYDNSFKIPVYANSGDQPTPLVGDILYDSGSGLFNYYNGTSWIPVAKNTNLPLYVLKAGDTMTGTLILNTDSGEQLILKDGAGLHGYMTYRSTTNSTKGYIGYPSGGSTDLTLSNIIGDMQLTTNVASYIKYTGILSANNGRQIIPNSATLPGTPIAGELYADGTAGNLQPKYYNGLYAAWYAFKTLLNSPNWCSCAINGADGSKYNEPLNNEFTFTSSRLAAGTYVLTFSVNVHTVTVSCNNPGATSIINVGPNSTIPYNIWTVAIKSLADAPIDQDFFFHARQ